MSINCANIQSIGTTISNLKVTCTIDNLSQINVTPLIDIKLYINNTLIETKAFDEDASSYEFNVSSNITTNSTIEVRATYNNSVGVEEYVSETTTLTFVYPIYYGNVTNVPSDVNSVKTLSSVLSKTGNCELKFTTIGQKMLIASPYEFDKLISVETGYELHWDKVKISNYYFYSSLIGEVTDFVVRIIPKEG